MGINSMGSKKTAIITGITGQDGSYLADLLVEKSYSVIGLTRDVNCKFSNNIAHLEGKVELLSTDYSRASIDALIKNTQPDEIYNMTGQTYVGKSWIMVDETIDASGLIPIHIIQSILDVKSDTRLFQASSSEIYTPMDGTPIKEGANIWPSTPYGCSKALAHQMVCAFRNNYGLHAVNGIFFSHESPRRGSDFLTMKVVNEALNIKQGTKNSIKLGNLDVKRDWGHAREFAEAAHLILQQDTPVDYHICTGILHTVGDVVDFIFSHLGMDYKEFIDIDTNLVRSIEPKAVCGSNAKISQDLGWTPKVSFENMLIEIIAAEQKKRS